MSKIVSVPLLWRSVRQQQSAYSEMSLGPQLFRDQCIGCFLHTVVGEPIGAFRTHDEFLAKSLPQTMDLRFRCPVKPGKRGDLGTVAKARELLQCIRVSTDRRLNFPIMRSTTLSV